MVSNKVSLQNQLQNPALVTLKNLMRPLTARLGDGYCSITTANYRLITVIRFVAKSYTYPKKILQIDFIKYFMHAKFFFRDVCVLEF